MATIRVDFNDGTPPDPIPDEPPFGAGAGSDGVENCYYYSQPSWSSIVAAAGDDSLGNGLLQLAAPGPAARIEVAEADYYLDPGTAPVGGQNKNQLRLVWAAIGLLEEDIPGQGWRARPYGNAPGQAGGILDPYHPDSRLGGPLPMGRWLRFRIEALANLEVTLSIRDVETGDLEWQYGPVVAPSLSYGGQYQAFTHHPDFFKVAIYADNLRCTFAGTSRAVTRVYPRDDGRGASSAPRIHPPPRAGRTIAGHQ